MASDAWARLSAAGAGAGSGTASRRLQARYAYTDLLMNYDDMEEEAARGPVAATEFVCPFCAEAFDFIGLCFHIDDDHAAEAKSGVCPICASSIGNDFVGHLTMQHGSYFKVQRRRRLRKVTATSSSLLSLLRKDLRDSSIQNLLGGTFDVVTHPTATPEPDTLLSSLGYGAAGSEPSRESNSELSKPAFSYEKTSQKKLSQRVEPSLSEQEKREKAQRSEFLRELMLSAIFDENL